MDQSIFRATEPCLDELAEIIDKHLTSSEWQTLQNALTKVRQALGERYSLGIDMVVHVFDPSGERSMPLLTTGLAIPEDGEPYRTWSDSTPQRYVAKGEIQIVPHDRCPVCWKDWDFKFRHRACPHCGATLGKDVKVLLDNDVCPHCEEGAISPSSPKCEMCGHEVDLSLVTWG